MELKKLHEGFELYCIISCHVYYIKESMWQATPKQLM
jgi:hypothetical protein